MKALLTGRQETGSPTSRRVYIRTYGCQMNVYDSERMAELLAPLGYARTEVPEAADLIVLNTCHIREKAAEKVYSDLGRLVPLQTSARRAGRRVRFVVAGCVAQAEGAEIRRRRPEVDIVVGPQTYHRLPELLARADRANAKATICTDFPAERKFDELPSRSHPGPAAFLSVQEGCDRFCTFCVVPYTRGAEYSRPVADVVREAESLVRQGARELCLLGQNVNAYHGLDPSGKEISLAGLLRELARIDGVWRLRYTTSHPANMTEELIRAHGDLEALMPYLHLPVQSGSDRVLRAMNRAHTAESFRATVRALRGARPDLALSSDFIVGFPGETESDFEATLQLVEDTGFAAAYSFRYSRRPGTPAAVLTHQVPEPEKARRLSILQARLAEQQHSFNCGFLNATVPVLFERRGRRPGQLAGRSPWMHAVHADADEALLGTLQPVRVTRAGPHGLAGELANHSEVAAG